MTLLSSDLLPRGGRPTRAVQDFLDRIPALKDIKVAAFDTRLTTKWVRVFGYAAGRIADTMIKNGGKVVVPPEGFFVKGTEGPLGEGEVERAESWGNKVSNSLG